MAYIPPKFFTTPFTTINHTELKVGERIGEGGYGQVYHALWKRQEQNQVVEKVVAVKRILVEASTLQLASFKREIGLAMSLRHPSLVHVHGVCPSFDGHSNDHALVMQYLPFNMAKLITGNMPDGRRNDLSTADYVLMLMDVARGLAYLHNLPNHINSIGASIIHADLKPANILLTRAHPYRAKIADFGISHMEQKTGITYTQTLRTSAATAGTPQYMAHELFDDEPLRGTYNDMYSFGCVALELFTHQKPWPGLNPHQVLARVLQKRVPDVPDTVPALLRPLIRDCLDPTPTTRPSATQAFDRLTNIRDGLLRAQTKQCCICQDQRPAYRGWECSSKHFICCDIKHDKTRTRADYQPHVDADNNNDTADSDVPCIAGLITAAMEPVKLRRYRGFIPCPVPDCKSDPFGNRDVAKLVQWGQAAVTEMYMAKMQDFIATLLQTPTPTPAHDTVEQQKVRELSQHRTHIIEEIINLQCPGCRAVFVDYDGCDALTCEACGIAFCALCLANCGADAHQHVARTHGQVYGGVANFRRVHTERRTRLLYAYLDRIRANMTVNGFQQLLQLIFIDAHEAGIDLQQYQGQKQQEDVQKRQEQERQRLRAAELTRQRQEREQKRQRDADLARQRQRVQKQQEDMEKVRNQPPAPEMEQYHPGIYSCAKHQRGSEQEYCLDHCWWGHFSCCLNKYKYSDGCQFRPKQNRYF